MRGPFTATIPNPDPDQCVYVSLAGIHQIERFFPRRTIFTSWIDHGHNHDDMQGMQMAAKRTLLTSERYMLTRGRLPDSDARWRQDPCMRCGGP